MTGLTYSMWSYDLRPPKHPRLVGILEQIRQTEAQLDSLRKEYTHAEAELAKVGYDQEAARTAAKMYEQAEAEAAARRQRDADKAAANIERLKAQKEAEAERQGAVARQFGRDLK